ncbi:MAG: glycosyltransferase, partial [Promicromonosporaceae bacterium]|nr:glycosyltransferase [Promicromonosporaceae bacterium]
MTLAGLRLRLTQMVGRRRAATLKAWMEGNPLVTGYVIARLSREGLVDPTAYGELVSRRFGSRLAVARHFMKTGIAAPVDFAAVRAGLDSRVTGRASVIIPTFRDSRLTLAAVEAVTATTSGSDVEVLVVDNGSPPLVALALARGLSRHPQARMVRSAINRNFSGGTNLGSSLATGDTLVFLNNDTLPQPGWLPPLLSPLADPAVRGTQPLLLFDDGTIQAAGTDFVAPDTMPIVPLAGRPAADAQIVRGLPFAVVTAACLAMRASEFAELDGFDEAFVNGSEDIDLCLRAIERFGGAFAVEPGSVVVHLESRTPGRFRALDANRSLFMKRWAGRLPEPTQRLYHALGLEIAELGSDGKQIPSP